MENINRNARKATVPPTGFIQPPFVVNDGQVPYLIQAVPTDPTVYPQIFYAVHPANLPPSQINSPPTSIPLSEINQNKQDPTRVQQSSNKFNHPTSNEATTATNFVNPSQNLFTSASYVQMPANPIPSNNGPQVKQSSRYVKLYHKLKQLDD